MIYSFLFLVVANPELTAATPELAGGTLSDVVLGLIAIGVGMLIFESANTEESSRLPDGAVVVRLVFAAIVAIAGIALLIGVGQP